MGYYRIQPFSSATLQNKRRPHLSRSEIDSLWSQCKEGSLEAKERLAAHYKETFVRRKAEQFYAKKHLPAHVQVDDLEGEGLKGMSPYLDTFEPTRGNKFEAYVGRRVEGAMIDFLREEGWVPRAVWKKAKAKDKIDNGEKTERLVSMGNVNESQIAFWRDVEDRYESPEQESIRMEEQQKVQKAILKLPERERLALILHYYEGLDGEKLAERLTLSVEEATLLLSQAKENVKEFVLEKKNPNEAKSSEVLSFDVAFAETMESDSRFWEPYRRAKELPPDEKTEVRRRLLESIAEIKSQKKLTWRELEAKTGLTFGFFNPHVNFRAFPQIKNLNKVSKALDLSPQQMMSLITSALEPENREAAVSPTNNPYLRVKQLSRDEKAEARKHLLMSISEIRAERNLTVQELETRTQLSSNLFKLNSSKRCFPRIENLHKVADALELSWEGMRLLIASAVDATV